MISFQGSHGHGQSLKILEVIEKSWKIDKHLKVMEKLKNQNFGRLDQSFVI